jgi:hypothetical protein
MTMFDEGTSLTAAIRLRRSVVAAAAVMLVTTGCAHTFDASTVGVEATMASPAAAPAQGEPFVINRKATFFLWGMLPGAQPSLADVLNAQAGSTDRVADLSIRVRSSFADMLITVLTAGLIVPRSVTYEGVIVSP